jgi:hypothetical protein
MGSSVFPFNNGNFHKHLISSFKVFYIHKIIIAIFIPTYKVSNNLESEFVFIWYLCFQKSQDEITIETVQVISVPKVDSGLRKISIMRTVTFLKVKPGLKGKVNTQLQSNLACKVCIYLYFLKIFLCIYNKFKLFENIVSANKTQAYLIFAQMLQI